MMMMMMSVPVTAGRSGLGKRMVNITQGAAAIGRSGQLGFHPCHYGIQPDFVAKVGE
jgi:hypothetical protein